MAMLTQQVMGEWSPQNPTVVTVDPQPLVMGLSGPMMPRSPVFIPPQQVGVDTAIVSFAVPVAVATAQTNDPITLTTYLPPAGSATAQGNVPVLLDTYTVPVGSATAQANVPVLAATAATPVATATAQGNVPTVLVTYAVPAATATAAALVPFFETTADAWQSPLVTFGFTGITTIPGTTVILRPQEVGADPVPVIVSTFAVPVATATAQANVPTVLSTHLPPAATATAQSNVPVVKVTYAPPVATATAAAPTPIVIGPAIVANLVFYPPVSAPNRQKGLLPMLHSQYQDVLHVSTVRGTYTFSGSYMTGGETLTIPIQRVVIQLLAARLAGGFGIVWTGTKLQAWNLDGSGNLTTEVTAGTDLSSVTVPIIAYVIAH
jgi:hypothetical protein